MNAAQDECLILGGAGYIGHNWADRLSGKKVFKRIIQADARPPSKPLAEGCEFVQCDVRQPLSIKDAKPRWIFNFAAVHREPGHAREEYFDTNLAGAKNACAFAEETGCENIFFTSSIAVYGTLSRPTSETSPPYPATPYGISKLCAEFIHKGWQRAGAGRRLHICRPGVIYGPGDPGNILRMIRAVRKGYFVFPGSKHLRKSYGYIEGLLDSFEFIMARPEKESALQLRRARNRAVGGLGPHRATAPRQENSHFHRAQVSPRIRRRRRASGDRRTEPHSSRARSQDRLVDARPARGADQDGIQISV